MKTMTQMLGITMLLTAGFTACQNSNKNVTLIENATNDSIVQTDTLSHLLQNNENQYPMDCNIMENFVLSDRLKKITGELYPDIINNFNTQTPIVSEKGIYKFTGGKAHNVPAFLTSIFYDSKTDNLNVWVERNGKKTIFVEKDTIKVPQSLLNK